MTRPIAEAQQFYLTAPGPCPYLPGRQERKVFTQLAGPHSAPLNDILSQGGFRRSQTIAYRPACDRCAACVSVRVCADLFSPTRSMRRITQRNRDLVSDWRDNIATTDQYALFYRYLEERHSGGGMLQMTVLDYSLMVEDSHVETKLVEYRRRTADSATGRRGDGDLIACALTDVLADGLSMVYSFFDPEEKDRSLGTFIILDHIERAKRLGKPYVYLGYWVEGSRKMAYKSRFRPQERLTMRGWERFC
ncbi:arginine-tRNA-protein transferase [Rhodopseudomonas julia]|uniref:Aspartate/glutamate leucyltransferase n=1 Tax=Rhodopseudomonas julia TaxID=200617 RepID=A0ABU0C9Q0_9BRAD|nr:arginyltransferase [Rhodopseudomonas julia]MDQ0327241.1 arginine-tRNA-protein transferase [Rhodopseudomonas julia]